MATKQDLDWAKAKWRETLTRCLRSLAAQLQTDARHLLEAEQKAKRS